MFFVKNNLQNDLKFNHIGDIILAKLQNYAILGGKLMKKILSVMLAVLTLFSVLSIGASAVEPGYFWNQQVTDGVVVSDNIHTILTFDFAGGTSTNALPVFDTTKNGFVNVDAVGDTYIMLPGSKSDCYLTAGSSIKAPFVDAPENYKFNGWYCYENNEYYVAGEKITIPSDWIGKVVEFEASYLPAKVEGDTMKTVLGVLTKVFGTILGILFLDGSSSAGIELVEKLLGGLLG